MDSRNDHNHTEPHSRFSDHIHHEHHHPHPDGRLLRKIAAALHLPGFGHDHLDPAADEVIYQNKLGLRTIKLSLWILGITTGLQFVIYILSGSVALLADTVHNLGDTLNSVPLLIAFILAKRLPNKRFTYGYGRAEDVAGLLIVFSIGFSAVYILWQSIDKLIHPEPLSRLGWLTAAALIGFIGNEIVALMEIRVGRTIGSEAMVADGLHARTDGLTSLAVLLAAGGTWLGYPIIDPIIGIFIGWIIIGITWNATKAVFLRLMNGVNPDLTLKTEKSILSHPEIERIARLQLCWIGHRLQGEVVLVAKGALSIRQINDLTTHIQHHLSHALPCVNHFTIQLNAAD